MRNKGMKTLVLKNRRYIYIERVDEFNSLDTNLKLRKHTYKLL